jgi:hypothetical protein
MATVRYFASLEKFKVAHYRTGRHHSGVRSVESNNLRIKKALRTRSAFFVRRLINPRPGRTSLSFTIAKTVWAILAGFSLPYFQK